MPVWIFMLEVFGRDRNLHSSTFGCVTLMQTLMQYAERVMEIEQGTFTPLVFTTTSGMADECAKYHSRLAELIANKNGESCSSGISWIRAKGGHGNNGYNNTHSSSASPEKTADITYAVVEQGNSMPRTAPKKPLRTYETEILVEGNGSGYEVAGSSSRRPEEPPGKKPKKQKKGQEPDKPVGVVYAQVDKSKQKSKASKNTYDQSERPKSKQPGELTYAELDHAQGSSMPRNSAAPTKKPQPYVETEYAMIV
ncbi:unnamed protein product [Porites evermanni]|uniref:Uncharacterized protein n=1 Tax=Porites evermanni TaxID=104178 RepID=A0ABN8ME52_9CNID|nr:unnamed protein product [Porites evermanni]